MGDGTQTQLGKEKPDNTSLPKTGGDGKMTTADLAYGQEKAATKAQSTTNSDDDEHVSLIEEKEAGTYRERWTSIQTHFIDEPRETVSDADTLVAEVIQSLATRFAQEREGLEHQWQAGSEVSTEDLRQAMQHYRSFFERLLAA
jgi:hypothetical protein